jgi:hypothetical protein
VPSERDLNRELRRIEQQRTALLRRELEIHTEIRLAFDIRYPPASRSCETCDAYKTSAFHASERCWECETNSGVLTLWRPRNKQEARHA